MSSKIIDVHDTEASLPELVTLVLEGNEVIIAEDNKPLARLVPISAPTPARIAGLNRGELWTSEDFDEALPESFWTETL